MGDTKGDGILTLNRRILNPVGFELTGKAPVQAGVNLGGGRLYRVRKAIQEVGQCNHPLCLRKQLFTKSVQVSLGVVGVPDLMYIDRPVGPRFEGWMDI